MKLQKKEAMIQINTLYNEDCLKTMARMSDGFVDLVVTSPPYDKMRDYTGYVFEFEKIAKELYRVIKNGGVLVWVVGDQTIKGSETGESFRQVLYFKNQCRFNIGDTMIFKRNPVMNFGSNDFYIQCFEFMFVLTKGKLKTKNLLKDRKLKTNVIIQQRRSGKTNGLQYDNKIKFLPKFGKRYNIWEYNSATKPEDITAQDHPAIFPERLAEDHIISWSNANDLVYDPFMGSGTTVKMAILNRRNWIGSEISKEYYDFTKKRIEKL